ncbi:histone-arginine methyltransferase CARMER isoform X2 [Armigeres subalbatus]|uniref:histone-arginine methyltransferase CARMER isoform X2 n=1 Tax=Armigeres subalbatus TaxID=124917 RepID=UPI002ED37490
MESFSLLSCRMCLCIPGEGALTFSVSDTFKGRPLREMIEQLFGIKISKEDFLTNVCVEFFETELAFTEHLHVHFAEVPLVCEKCDNIVFKSVRQASKHLALHDEDERPHKCRICELRFFTRENSLTHERKIHRLKVKIQKNIDGFADKQKLRTFHCKFCGQSAPNNLYLKKHELTHGPPPPTHACEVCGKEFTARKNLTRHLMIHTGILSFFAVQAGAAKVYAVEASNMAQYAQQLVHSNNLEGKITVIAGKIEEIELPEMVDVIISEPMGYMLYNERMLETYLHGKKWLRPEGKMFPSRGDLHVAPFTDEALYMEQYNKANFWMQTEFHGVNLVSLRDAAMKEYFRQPIVDTFDIRICMAKSIRHTTNFLTADEKDLHRIQIDVEFHILETGTCHGLAFWFDVEFAGSCSQVWLSTAPTESLTHWYQVRCLLQTPIFVKQGQVLSGKVVLAANQRQSYDVEIDLKLEGTMITSTNTLDLKNPYFRYTGAPVPAPPGSNTTSPSEAYWGQLDAQGARNAVNLVNGITVNGLGEVDMTMINTNLMPIGNQPNIHPGLISSTGRQQSQQQTTPAQQLTMNPTIACAATSTQNVAQQQLIGGAISPSLFTTPTQQIINSHHSQPIHGAQFY